ncbi:hypothetical protein V7968_32760 [Nocardia vulneris]|uniref:hypothetical protein n=1 Tax=Nocardia vulneris TaxID=1141657 RepID=UPI0030CDECFE
MAAHILGGHHHSRLDDATTLLQDLVRTCRPARAEHEAALAHARTEILRQWSAGDTAAALLGYWQDLVLT